MKKFNQYPNIEIATSVVASMTGEYVISAERMPTGDQNFVFAVKTSESEYVLRMTDEDHKNKFISAIYWQEKLIPLGVPLAQFIKTDLNHQYSSFPSLLMKRLPGVDLVHAYPDLTRADKQNLAKEIINIQSLLNSLPLGSCYGITDTYEHTTDDKTWYDFLVNRLLLFKDIISKNAVFDPNLVTQVIYLTQAMENDLKTVKSTPFLWDASERNVLVYQGKITGIVDVDEICFGDPLFVIALTAVALACEGYDTEYTDDWTDLLQLDNQANRRLNLYKLFYVVVFMRKHAMQTANKKTAMFDINRLNNLFIRTLALFKP